MRQKAILTILTFVFALILAGGAMAVQAPGFLASGNPTDAAYGLDITSEGYENSFDYDDIAGNPRPTVYGETIETVVAPVYGYSLAPGDLLTFLKYATPGSTEGWLTTVTNEGNADLTYQVTVSALSYTAGNNWDLSLYQGGVDYDLDLVGTVEDNASTEAFEFRVTLATTETDAPDESLATFEIIATTGHEHAGNDGPNNSYHGANDLDYGGKGWDGPTVYGVETVAPILNFTSNVVTVEAPDDYYTQSGSSHEVVPGALMIFTITYTNEGTGNARNVIVADAVPVWCQAYKFNVQEDESNVLITAPTQTGFTWEAFWTSDASPDFATYDASGWTSVGNITAPNVEQAIDTSATYIKWQIDELLSGETGTLQWSVTID